MMSHDARRCSVPASLRQINGPRDDVRLAFAVGLDQVEPLFEYIRVTRRAQGLAEIAHPFVRIGVSPLWKERSRGAQGGS